MSSRVRTKTIGFAFLCAWFALSTYAGATGLTVDNPHTDSNGVIWYDATSAYNGPGATILRVLEPTNPASGMPHRFIHVLPVIAGWDPDDEFGDGLEELRALNVHNTYNAHIISPSFQFEPWYANHNSDDDRKYENFMVQHLVPWVQANFSVTGQEEHWLIGFSKSGFGAMTLLFRNPTVFAAAAAWDFPANQPDTDAFGMEDNYGTEANFQNNYRLTTEWIAARAAPFQTHMRLWLSKDYVTYAGDPTYQDDVLDFAERLEDNDVQFIREDVVATRIHTWTSGWLLEAVAGLHNGVDYDPPPPPNDPPPDEPPPDEPPPPPNPSGEQDDFNRANGPLGANWVRDPWWGTGMSIVNNQVTATVGHGGAYYWDAQAFGADQYAQITLKGTIGDWVGVVVRGNVSPGRGYWVAIKPTGAYLYAFMNGVFHQLGSNGTPWAAGDVLRLEVRTVASATARLTVFRNGQPLFTVDDTEHFIATGQPGIGMYASTAVALDNWEGGELEPMEPPPPPNPSGGQDDFNRANGALGANWVRDPWWGTGMSIANNQGTATVGTGGAHYWDAQAFGADQYAQITLKGAIGDWVGVVVRGNVSPGRGYWVAIKPTGAYLYAFGNEVFHQLGSNGTHWVTGDVLRLEVRTVASATARLTVFRNDQLLFAADDTEHFIATGQPGIGMYASTAVALDNWEGGELEPIEPSPPPNPSGGQDDFNRANGVLGVNWVRDPWWGTGMSIANNQGTATVGTGGAHYWDAQAFGADQYAQITLKGAIGDWVGVVVRGNVSPGRGYWVAIKPTGAYLYAFGNEVFHQLGSNGTHWVTGDVLRLEVSTVASATARLTVFRNGQPLFTADDTEHFIATGQPGIGMHASTAVALDNWQGGEVVQDDFNRANGALGANWVRDPWWGTGMSIANNQGTATVGTGGAHYWDAQAFGADQYAQITLKGAIGDWVGVVVRGNVSSGRGYWVAIKPTGAYLYAFGNEVFHQLGSNGTHWVTGDVLRLEVRTVASATARLTVFRNGQPLFTADDSEHFIATGQPGIGMHASTAVALDDWKGGELVTNP